MLGSRRRLLSVLSILAVITLLGAGDVFGAATGKIMGIVSDQKTGEPMIGVSVMIVGSDRGAMTDLDGKFVITQLEPGEEYVLRISSVNYNTVEVTHVVVKADITTEINAEMEESTTELDKVITVRGKQDQLQIYETHTAQTISKESIDRAPVTTVDELLTQVPGIITNSQGEVFIRGGRAGEVAYIVDGVPLRDPLGGLGQAGAQLSLVSGSIQELQVIKDGFDPEYGDALSGIVKVTSQTGSKDNTRFNVQFRTDDFGNSDFNKYSRNNDYMRFSLSGPDPFLKNKILPALGLKFLEGKELTYYVYAEIDKSDGIFQYSDYDTPLTQRPTGFFNLFGVKIPDRLENRYYWMANLKFRPRQNLKLILSYSNRQIKDTYFLWGHRYTSSTAPVYERDWSSLSLEISQALTKDMTYEAVFSYSENGVSLKPGDPTDPGTGRNPDDFKLNHEWETYTDRNGNGVYDPPEPLVNLYPDTLIYGDGFTGPRYTFGEFNFEQNIQGGTFPELSSFRFNDNGYIDFLEGEPFIDLNGNGVWDYGDYLNDKNGNGILDDGRINHINVQIPEPYIDGDSIVGEPFHDLNGNRVYDPGIDGFRRSAIDSLNDDKNHNGRYDGPNDPWDTSTQYIDRNGNGLYDPPSTFFEVGEEFTDINGNGQRDAGGFLSPLSYNESALWHYHNTKTIRGEVKVFRQFGPHELKGGVAIEHRDLLYQEIEKPYILYTGRSDGGPYPDRGAFRDMFNYQPWGGTAYLRDKLEYGSMIASLGLRWDFFIQDKHNLVEVAQNDDLGSGVILGDRQKFSPRIGFSYPISDKAKVHFNYGHFYQLPDLIRMYARNTTAVDADKVIGNYNLDYKKTVQYSFGVKYAMSEFYTIDVSGYFKDEFDKVNSAMVTKDNLNRNQYRNVDYGRSRGFELTIDKRGGGYVGGQLSYTYAFAFGKASETSREWRDEVAMLREPLSESALDHDVRHSLKSNVQIFIPNNVKPRLFGLSIPNGWSLMVSTFIESGRPFTPDPIYPNVTSVAGENIQRNSLRKPSVVLFDMKFTKEFNLVGLDMGYIIQVENIFDVHNVVDVYSSTGRPDTRQNPSGIVKGGTDSDLNPSNWDYGRQIQMGIELHL
ncbi:MAG: TonB-dependent receptor [candidate division Zixibacteria bacterium]|nr:TonB-dependent receptor [candidate division Zixibacteria bacterium]